MHVQRILFPTDLSEISLEALDLAASIAKESDAELMILHIKEPSLTMAGAATAQATLPERDDVEPQLAKVRPRDTEVKFSHHLLIGSPASAILQFSRDQEIDMIVMSTHGRTGLKRLMMGSVAELVVRSAVCPVLTLKQPIADTVSV